MANELTDSQARRERIAELRVWTIPVGKELADAYERIETLEKALRSISKAKPNEWEPDVRDQFQPWAQNIARFALKEQP